MKMARKGLNSVTQLMLQDCAFSSNESPVASLQVLHDVARAHLEIRSPQGRSLTRAEGFTVQDGADNGRLQLALVNGNFPVLGISQSGQSGPHSVEITASDDGARGLKMHDQDGHPLFSVSAANNGRTYLNIRHPDHERSLQISAGPKDADGPLIELFAPAKQDGTGVLRHLFSSDYEGIGNLTSASWTVMGTRYSGTSKVIIGFPKPSRHPVSSAWPGASDPPAGSLPGRRMRHSAACPSRRPRAGRS